jgi:cAMP response element-binding protein
LTTLNSEAAKKFRLKKNDYVRFLEDRVTLLENQNKTLLTELKALHDLYENESQS